LAVRRQGQGFFHDRNLLRRRRGESAQDSRNGGRKNPKSKTTQKNLLTFTEYIAGRMALSNSPESSLEERVAARNLTASAKEMSGFPF
jgi:hypothetical protein